MDSRQDRAVTRSITAIPVAAQKGIRSPVVSGIVICNFIVAAVCPQKELLMSANALFRPTFADLRAEIERRAADGAATDEINALVDQFLSTGGDAPAPWVEYDGTVTWFYRDAAAETVAVIGDILGYDP